MNEQLPAWKIAAKQKPKLRGVSHIIFFFVSLFTGYYLYSIAPANVSWAILVYVSSITALFGVSGLLHYPDWEPKTRMYLRQLDHSMIFVLIAGTYTALITLLPASNKWIVSFAWICVFAGTLSKLFLFTKRKLLTAIPYLLMGWVCVFEFINYKEHIQYAGINGIILCCFGGLFYTTGAICYARKKPNPIVNVFGYHEIFHLCVILGCYSFYATVYILLQIAANNQINNN